jgi:endonuclease/exonuclease/phosphatase family metal-dependent hydrolase
MFKRIFKIIGIIVGAVAVIALAYVLYVILSYDRIPDKEALEPGGSADVEYAEVNREYTIVTQNCGFGAYSPDFTFFMDGGTQSWAESRESVIANIDMAAEKALSYDPDFVLLQEVDTDSTRSYHVDQRELVTARFPGYDQVFAVNYHSAFLMYPFYQPHGASNSGIMTLCKTDITSALRRSLTISTGFSKFLDLDRCYSVSRIPVDNGRELVIYNVHTSAYGGSDEIRTAQITMIAQDMLAEYEKGNYCVCGGDFNHDFTGDSTLVLGGTDIGEFGWAQPFPVELLPEGITQCIDYDDEELIATCRNCDVPYGPDCQVFVVDGFLVSDNVRVEELHNIDAGFAYSDHNPVVMRFVLE